VDEGDGMTRIASQDGSMAQMERRKGSQASLSTSRGAAWRTAGLLCTVVALSGLAGCASDDGPRAPARSAAAGASSPTERPFDPKASARAHTELATGYLELGNLAVALEEARIALAADANYAVAHNVMGLIQMELRDAPGAQASFERALRLDPKDPDTNHNYGTFLCENGRAREGIRHFMVAVANPLYPSPAKSHAAAANCLQRAGEADEARDHLERALRLDPNFVPALLLSARAEFARGDIELARTRITRFNQIATPTAETLWLALRVERLRGDRASEAAYAAQLRRRFPNAPETQALERGQFR